MKFTARAETFCGQPSLESGGVLFYSGPSMNPLLRENDLLELIPCAAAGIMPGDVIAFENRDANQIVIHRVVKIGAGGLLTRGDNNSGFDAAPVHDDQIIGRVATAWRGTSKVDVAGGRHGLLLAQIRWLLQSCRRRCVARFNFPGR